MIRRFVPKRTTLPFGLCNIQTDTTFMANRGDGLECTPAERQLAYRKARAAGVNPNGKTYCPQLAKEHFDPEAWIDSKADVKRICANRGLDCEGAVNIKARPTDLEPEPYRVAPDIVEREVEKTIEEQQLRPTPKQRRELAEATHERLMPASGTPS